MRYAKAEDEARRKFPNPCEYNPATGKAAFWSEVHASADWIVGHNGKWRLCAACAALPEFKNYRVRYRVTTKEERLAAKLPVGEWHGDA